MKDLGFNLENTYINLPKIFYSKQKPSHVSSPELVIFNESLAQKLGLNFDGDNILEGIDIFSGNKLPEGCKPISKAYAGHQFGHFTMLGDGRAVLLGEQITPNGERFDIELKGSGRTPYSRGGDGKAALGPMLREYIISEAMKGLKVPTTESLAVVETGEVIVRDNYLSGAILTRLASSHIRVGTFEFASRFGDFEDVKALADYTIDRHYKEALESDNKYLYFLKAVIKNQAKLIAKWQLVGFIHGVMNTDNMTICGETIDYGPCAFMDEYNPSTVFSSIDSNGRYSYGNQPNIGAWNLSRFAETLLCLISENQKEAINLAKDAISDYFKIFEKEWLDGMRRKIGLFTEEDKDEYLIEGLLSIMKKYNADYTNTFRALSIGKPEETGIFDKEEFNTWFELWNERLIRQKKSKEEVLDLMKKNNPEIIPRNHKVEEVLKAAVSRGDYEPMNKFIEALKNPYEYSGGKDEYIILPTNRGIYKTFCGT